MNRTRRARWRRANRWLMAAFALILLAGVVMQIGMMARLSGQSKQAAEVERDIRALAASADNLNLSISQYHDLDRITARAQQLGMQRPDETQLRVVNLPMLAGSTSTQSADNSGAEEIMD